MVVFIRRWIFQFLILLSAGVWLAVFQSPDQNLHVIACDVGQGDAILITYKNLQILTDGGPNNKVLDCLSKHLPFWDRNLELVILTHPDADHSTGLIDVIKRYNVDTLLMSDSNVGTQVYQALKKEVGSRATNIIGPYKDQRLGLGMIYLDILHPSETFTGTKTNDYSIVYLLQYGNFEALLTGDIEDNVSDLLVSESEIRSIEYIKVPHHGSKNGLSEKLLKAFVPKTAVISVGKNNRYGHPHQEVLDLLNKYQTQVFRTDLERDVEVVTDGKEYWKIN